MKKFAGIFIGLILMSLTLTAVVGCSSSGGDTSSSSDSGSNDSGNDDSVSLASGYAVVDSGQTACYDDSDGLVNCPVEGEAFYGQDARYDGNQPSYTDNGDGTVTDNVTGLMWQQSPDTDGDGDIDADDKLTYDEAAAGAYIAFGRAMGYMDGAWTDVHGAGAQRSDPKSGDPADYPTGNGPQGDAIRLFGVFD